MRFLKSFLIITILYLSLPFSLKASQFNLLNDVTFTPFKKGVSVIFSFDHRPQYKIFAKQKGVIIKFEKTRIANTDWIKNIRRSIIKSIDIGAENGGIKVDFSTEKPVFYRVKALKKGLVLTLMEKRKSKLKTKKDIFKVLGITF